MKALLPIFIITALGFITMHPAHGKTAEREIEFSVYAQYPIRQVVYRPVAQTNPGTDDTAPETRSIQSHTLSRTGPYLFKGSDEIIFYDARTHEPVGQVKVDNTSSQWLFIFVRNPKYKADPAKAPRYLIYPFNDSRDNLPSNGLVFLNMSGRRLDGLLENKRVRFEIGESNSFRIQESLPINLWARDFNGEKLLPALIKTYHFQPKHRYLMILFPPVLSGSVDLDVRLLEDAAD